MSDDDPGKEHSGVTLALAVTVGIVLVTVGFMLLPKQDVRWSPVDGRDCYIRADFGPGNHVETATYCREDVGGHE